MKLELDNDSTLPDEYLTQTLQWVANEVGVPKKAKVIVHVDNHGIDEVSGMFTPFFGITYAPHLVKGKKHLAHLSVSGSMMWYPIESQKYHGEDTPALHHPVESLIAVAAHELQHVVQHANGVLSDDKETLDHMEKEAVVTSRRVLEKYRNLNGNIGV